MNVEELRDRVTVCDTPGTIATMDWSLWSKKIRERILFDDPRQFLSWPCIQNTMHVMSAPYIQEELDFALKLNPARWRKALREHPFGGARITNDQFQTSANVIHMVYHIAMFEHLSGLSISDFDSILDVGGGYGCMRRVAQELGFNGLYGIFDLPVLLALQEFYLNATMSGPTLFVDDVDDFIPNGKSLCIAMWSLSEMPLRARAKVERRLRDFDYTFFAYQESFAMVDNRVYFYGIAERIGHEKLAVRDRYKGSRYLLTRKIDDVPYYLNAEMEVCQRNES